jgi:hypothetical protein
MKLSYLLAAALASLALAAGCDRSSTDSSSKTSSTEEKSEKKKKKKSLEEREDELFAELMKIGEENKDDCDAMGKEMKALVKRESETIEEINEAYEAMSDDEKEAKKKASQKRQNKYDGLAVIVCSVKNKSVAEAGDKIVPATASK